MHSLLLGLKSLSFIWLWLPVVIPRVSAVVLHTSSRWILDSNNQRVKLRCVNWAGHMETNIPEGLQSQSIDYIASWIASNGFNCVRLTYSTDMALNPNVRVQDSFNNAAAAAGVPLADLGAVYRSAVSRNPFLATATVQETFGAVVDALGARNVLVVMDNHVSRASWCCGMSDGNGWWDAAAGYNAANSRFFNTGNWLEGLRRIARWSASRPNIVGISLRNELRAASGQDGNSHADWYRFTAEGCNADRSIFETRIYTWKPFA
jgi:hypothetical protein